MLSGHRGVAQLVEHRSPKPRVASSNLAAPAISGRTRPGRARVERWRSIEDVARSPARTGLPPGGSGGRRPRRLTAYFRGVWEELRKVVWPTWPELTRMTGVVVVTVILFSLLIGGADYALGYAVKPIYLNSSSASTTTTPTALPAGTATPSTSASASASPSPSATPSASPSASPSS